MNRSAPDLPVRDVLQGGCFLPPEAARVLRQIAREVRSARSFVLTTHLNPDGDALGSEAALALALRALGKEVRILNGHAVPPRYRDLLPVDLFAVAELDRPGAALPAPDWVVVLDTSDPERTGGVRPLVLRAGQRRMCIDHHLHEQGGVFDHHLLVAAAPSTGNLVLGLLDELGAPLERAAAQALWIALATDTGWFRFSNTTPWALADAARLLAVGLDPEALFEQLYGTQSVDRARFLGELLSSVRCELGGDLIWSLATRRALVERGLEVSDLEGAIDVLRTVGEARAVALVVEMDEERYKVSLRSRSDDVSVEAVARRFGGGGHRKAAGFRYRGRLEELLASLKGALGEELGRASRVGP